VEASYSDGQVDVSWSATDSGSGVAGYDLQVQVDSGDWTTLLADAQDTSYNYPADYAHRYTFRVTATDNVGNEGQDEASTITPNAVTKYYYFGGQRVAVRRPDGEVNWLHGDHLGSTLLATDGDGGEISRQLYYPFGEVRWASADMPTDFGYTGQRLDGTGLMFYHARYYAPTIGRFVSADTIIMVPLKYLHNPRTMFFSQAHAGER
jgi:RHS repeat-associated protein